MTALSPLRAGLTPTVGARVQSQGAALTGQAAFFRSAMEQATEAAKPEPAVAPPAASKPEVNLTQAEMPSRILRPGSLLDIRV